MTDLTESATWEAGVYQLETTDLVQGGGGGVDNLQAQQLGNRTLYLKQKLEEAGAGGTVATYSGDLDAITVTSFKYVDVTATNKPIAAAGYVQTVVQSTGASGYALQLYVAVATDQLWMRRLENGAWKAWVEQLTEKHKATQAEVDAGSDDQKFLTPKTLEDSAQILNARAGRKNLLINGNFSIWQRGISFAAANGYTVDRWSVFPGTSGSNLVTRESFAVGQTDVPNNPDFFMRIDPDGNATTTPVLEHKVEGVGKLAGKTAAISFYAKSPTGVTLSLSVAQRFGSGGSSSVFKSAGNAVLTSSWQRFEFQVDVPSVSGKTVGVSNSMGLYITSPALDTAITDIAQVQLEDGDKATDFELRPVAEELALCQRYYEKSYDHSVDPGAANGDGNIRYIAASTTQSQTSIPFKIEKRSTPAITLYSPGTGVSGVIRNAGGATDEAASSADVGTSGFVLLKTTTHTAGQSYLAHFTADAEL